MHREKSLNGDVMIYIAASGKKWNIINPMSCFARACLQFQSIDCWWFRVGRFKNVYRHCKVVLTGLLLHNNVLMSYNALPSLP